MGDIEKAVEAVMKGWTFEKGTVPPGGEAVVQKVASAGAVEDTKKFTVEMMKAMEERNAYFNAKMSEAETSFMTKEDEKAWEDFGESRKERAKITKQKKVEPKADPCAARLKAQDDLIESLKEQLSSTTNQLVAAVTDSERVKAQFAATTQDFSSALEEKAKVTKELDTLKDEVYREVPDGMTMSEYLEHLESRLAAYGEVTAQRCGTHFLSGLCRICSRKSPSLDVADRFNPNYHSSVCAVPRARKKLPHEE